MPIDDTLLKIGLWNRVEDTGFIVKKFFGYWKGHCCWSVEIEFFLYYVVDLESSQYHLLDKSLSTWSVVNGVAEVLLKCPIIEDIITRSFPA